MDGAGLWHDPLLHLWCCYGPSKLKYAIKLNSLGSPYYRRFFVYNPQCTRGSRGRSQHLCLLWRDFILWTSASNVMFLHTLQKIKTSLIKNHLTYCQFFFFVARPVCTWQYRSRGLGLFAVCCGPIFLTLELVVI